MASQPIATRPALRGVWFPLCLTLLLLLTLPGLILLVLHLLGLQSRANGWSRDNFSLTYNLALPWWAAVLLLLTPLLLLLLYFLKMKRKPLQVPSTFLWRKSIEDLQVNSLFQWLRDNVLLLIQLLIVLLLIYSAMSFQVHGSTAAGQHYILMIDNSASMSATDVQPNRLEVARVEALREIDRHGQNDFGMVIAFNSRASILQPYTNDKGLLRGAVKRIQPTQRPTRIEEALALADSLANPRKSAMNSAVAPEDAVPGKERQYVDVQLEAVPAVVHLFSDGGFGDAANFQAGNLDLRYHRAGQPGTDVNNVALVGLNAVRDRQDPSQVQVFARVQNFRKEGVKVRLELKWRIAGQDGFRLKDRARCKLTAASLDALKQQGLPEKVLEKLGPLKEKSLAEEQFLEQLASVLSRDELNQNKKLILDHVNQIYLKGRTVAPGDEEKNEPATVTPGEAVVTYDLENLEEGTPVVIQAKLQGVRDVFPLDDEAWLVLGIVRKARVLLVSPKWPGPRGNKILHDFFDQPAITRVARVQYLTPDQLKDEVKYLRPAQAGAFDLVIFDRCAPETEKELPLANTFFIDNVPPPWKRSAMPALPAKAIRNPASRHPLMRDLTGLDEIVFHEAFRFELDHRKDERVPPKTPRLLECDKDTAVLFALSRRAFTDLVLTFPLVNDRGEWASTWSLKLSLPLFFHNVLYQLGHVSDSSAEESLQPGVPRVLRPDTSAGEIKVLGPGDKVAQVVKRNTQANFVCNDTERVGVYRAEWPGGGQPFAVNMLDADESNLQPRDSVRIGAKELKTGSAQGHPRDIWKWWALAALVLLTLEWVFYHRRF